MNSNSSNTFGTFLTTLGMLGAMAVVAPRVEDEIYQHLIELITLMGRVGGEAPISSLAGKSGLPQPQFLKAIDQGKLKGLFETVEADGVSVLRLTSLGKAFIPPT